MKENNLMNIKGFENKDTFTQVDQFEVTSTKSASNRFIYDFSHSAENLEINRAVSGTSLENETDSGAQCTWIIRNKKNSLTSADSTVYPTLETVRPVLIGNPVNGNPYTPFVSGTTLTSDFSMTPDNEEVNLVPNIEENAIVFLNTGGNHTMPISYRSGYLELSFKTTKQNCIVGYGSSTIDVADSTVTSGSGSSAVTRLSGDNPANKIFQTDYDANSNVIVGNYYISEEKNSYINELSVNIKNGKLNISYNDAYGDNQTSFEVTGNLTVADGLWHHVVINFVRPGLLKNHEEKFNTNAIEFWIDGKLDKRTSEYVNDRQIFFPEILWLGANPNRIINDSITNNGWTSFDTNEFNIGGTTRTNWIGNNEFSYIFNGIWPDSSVIDAFSGAIKTFAHGINFPLNKFEIQNRYKFWQGDETPFRPALLANATMVNPAVSVNKKNVLKLFWNNVENKNGIELDNDYLVNSYSVTHKNKNSSTETYNLDIAKRKTYKILTNVRAAFKENMLIWGPGLVSAQNTKSVQTLATGQTRSSSTAQGNPNYISEYSGFVGPILDLKFSGIELLSGDRILLTNQIRLKDNGIWIFNGKDNILTRPADSNSPSKLDNAVVYVTEGYFKDTYWVMDENINSLNDAQTWTQLEAKPETTVWSQPFLTNRWTNSSGENRFIDLQSDLDISKFDLIVFMNYPETNEEIQKNLLNESDLYVQNKYKDFITSLRNVVADGASLYVSSPKLAQDLGIVKKFTAIDQSVESGDAQAASLSPFEVSEPAERYFDTHRINKYHVATTLSGLTNKNTYLLTDFIDYVPENINENEQYHAKYIYRQFGLNAGDEFIIPGLSLRKIQNSNNLPGYNNNQRNIKPIMAVDPSDINVGTIITKLSNSYYVGSTSTTNPYDDFATTIVVHSGQVLNNQAITGRIFVNCVEDGYTLSRKDYNVAQIQVIPENDTNETNTTRAWQYSTTRLNRLAEKVNIRELTQFGQTTPTTGGGGAIIQAPTNSSNGIIRSLTDKDNINYQSDLYTNQSEEIYPLQEIPVRSMTWLGLEWLAKR